MRFTFILASVIALATAEQVFGTDNKEDSNNETTPQEGGDERRPAGQQEDGDETSESEQHEDGNGRRLKKKRGKKAKKAKPAKETATAKCADVGCGPSNDVKGWEVIEKAHFAEFGYS